MSGHCIDVTVFKLLVCFKAKVCFKAIMTFFASVQNPPSEHVYPFGQQCSLSEQQTAFGKGQQPYCPPDSSQQVLPSGHSDCPPGHVTEDVVKVSLLHKPKNNHKHIRVTLELIKTNSYI